MSWPSNTLAVITGAGTGMGRALARQLANEGCRLAICDVVPDTLEETAELCRESAEGRDVSTHLCDVSIEEEVVAFRDAVAAAHATERVDLLFNNAGIGGGGSFVLDDRADWDKTFEVCWGGVYFCTRAFLPLLMASDDAHLINTSSVNGFWATLGPGVPHTAYSAAKFAVKGFTEALVNDLRHNAPNVHVHLVMPGHIGTSIAINSARILGRPAALELSPEDVEESRRRMAQMGLEVDALSDDEIRQAIHQRGIDFRDQAPVTAEQAAAVILDGVRAGRWRILVGEDAEALDRAVRADPERAYEPSFVEQLQVPGLAGILVEES